MSLLSASWDHVLVVRNNVSFLHLEEGKVDGLVGWLGIQRGFGGEGN